jgi:1,4-alpha-glucan branching enzyme
MSAHAKPPLGAHLHKHGASFRVWAPFAERVAVTGSFNNWSHTPLTSLNDGTWTIEIDGVEAGQEYKFVIFNGEQVLYKNDPRSLQLTTSSGGTSIVVDESFDWGDDAFEMPTRNKQVVYEMHIGTFYRPDPAMTGTFDDAAEKLDYLQNLGINVIELMPVSSMTSDRGWGYATDYIYAIESLYGGRRGLLEFVKAAHQRGIGVVLDVVYNHFGPDPNGLDLWRFDGWGENDKGGIYFYNDDRSETPWGQTRPDFGRTEVQDYILDSITMWMTDCRIDGLRVDSTIYIRNIKGWNNDPEHDIPEGWHILQRLTELARKINPNALLIAEDVGGNEYITMPKDAGGAGFGAQWELGLPGVLRGILGATEDYQRDMSNVCQILTSSFNGDPFQRVLFSDSHDSAANGGARLSELITPGNPTSVYARKRSLIASALVLTAPGTPMLFQGQEFIEGGSFNDWQAVDWKKSVTFAGIMQAHSHLIALRKNAHDNTNGLCGPHINIMHTDWDNKVLAYHRWENGGPGDDTVVILNFSNKTHQEYRLHFPHEGTWHVRFNSSWSGYSADFKDLPLDSIEAGQDGASVKLAPYAVLILSQDT